MNQPESRKPQPRPNALLVEPNVGWACRVASELREAGYEVVSYPSVEATVALTAHCRCAVFPSQAPSCVARATELQRRGLVEELLFFTNDDNFTWMPAANTCGVLIPKAFGIAALSAALHKLSFQK